MEPVEVISYVLHSVFAGVWAGSVVFLTLTVLPLARDGDIQPAPVQSMAGSIQTISRVSALLLFLTGSHLAAEVYTSESLTGTTPGQLVISMVVLWLVLIAAVEVGSKRLITGTDRAKLREPARRARPPFLLASLMAILLLAIGGLLTASRLGYLTL